MPCGLVCHVTYQFLDNIHEVIKLDSMLVNMILKCSIWFLIELWMACGIKLLLSDPEWRPRVVTHGLSICA